MFTWGHGPDTRGADRRNKPLWKKPKRTSFFQTEVESTNKQAKKIRNDDKIKKMNEQLAQMMLYTGVRDTKSFDPSVLHFD